VQIVFVAIKNCRRSLFRDMISEDTSMTQLNITRRRIIRMVATGAGLVASASSGTFVASATAQMAAQNVCSDPGETCGGWYWRRVADLLEWRGHKVFSPTLTGLGEHSHLLSKSIDMDTHITDIVNLFNWEGLDVAHSYGGAPGSGALEHIGGHVSSIVWLDALKLASGQSVLDVISDSLRKRVQAAADKGELSVSPPPKFSAIVVNEKDQTFVDSKLTPHPIRTYKQTIKLSGAIEKVKNKTYIRIPKYPAPTFDRR